MAKQSTSGRREQRPSFQLYAADFASSPKFRRMTLEERGAYLTLLLDAWMDRGIEPDSESIADRLCVDVEDAERLMGGTVGRCFEEVDGKLVNPRMERERARLEEKSTKYAANGSAGGRAPRATDEQLPSDCLANPGDREAIAKPSEQSRAEQSRVEQSRAEPELSPSGAEPEPEQSSEPDPTRGIRRAKHAGCTLEQHLAEPEFSALRSDIVEGARAWSGYRRTTRNPKLSPWGPAQWRPALRAAIRDPAAFTEGVQLSIRQKYQGLIVKDAPPAKRVNGFAPQSIQSIAEATAEAMRLAGEERPRTA